MQSKPIYSLGLYKLASWNQNGRTSPRKRKAVGIWGCKEYGNVKMSCALLFCLISLTNPIFLMQRMLLKHI
ncbi:hypothetical protein MKX01_042115, partial [Papaver californicum]